MSGFGQYGSPWNAGHKNYLLKKRKRITVISGRDRFTPFKTVGYYTSKGAAFLAMKDWMTRDPVAKYAVWYDGKRIDLEGLGEAAKGVQL